MNTLHQQVEIFAILVLALLLKMTTVIAEQGAPIDTIIDTEKQAPQAGAYQVMQFIDVTMTAQSIKVNSIAYTPAQFEQLANKWAKSGQTNIRLKAKGMLDISQLRQLKQALDKYHLNFYL